MEPPLMACGHTANSTTERNGVKIPTCFICAGIVDGYDVVVDMKPSLEGRMALCVDRHGRDGKGHTPVPSRWNMAFFEYRPDQEYDQFYCGCWGWD